MRSPRAAQRERSSVTFMASSPTSVALLAAAPPPGILIKRRKQDKVQRCPASVQKKNVGETAATASRQALYAHTARPGSAASPPRTVAGGHPAGRRVASERYNEAGSRGTAISQCPNRRLTQAGCTIELSQFYQ